MPLERRFILYLILRFSVPVIESVKVAQSDAKIRFPSSTFQKEFSSKETNLVEWNPINNVFGNAKGQTCMSGNGSVAIFAQSNGPVFYSTDFGYHWTESTANVKNGFTSGHWMLAISENGKYVLACSYRSYLYRSEDYGRTFQEMNFETDAYQAWYVAVSTTGEYFYLYSTFLTSPARGILIFNNYGRNLTTTVFPDGVGDSTVPMVMDKNDRLFIGDANSTQYLISTDYGYTWSIFPNMPLLPWCFITSDRSMQNSVAIYSGTTSQQDQGAYHTINGGNTWYKSDIPPLASEQWSFQIISSDFDTGRFVTMTGCTGYVYSSSDYGVTFQKNTPSDTTTACWLTVATDNSGAHLLLVHDPNDVPAVHVGIRDVYATNSPTVAPTITSQPSISFTPTSLPSSAPSCGVGRTHNTTSSGCVPCSPGHYSGGLDEASCPQCPVGTFSPGFGATECDECPYPWNTVTHGQTECTAININKGYEYSLSVLISLLVIVMGCIAVDKQRLPVALNLFFPTLDVFTDLAYLLTSDFCHWSFFLLGCAFLLFSVPFYLSTLWEVGAAPSLPWRLRDAWWLGVSRHHGEDMKYNSFANEPVVAESAPRPVFRVISRIAQFVTLVVWLSSVPVQVVFLTAWLVLGMFLHMSKVIALGGVWNGWFLVWTGSTLFATDIDVDTEALNEGLRQEFYLETVPQLVLQVVNSWCLGRLSALAWVSIAVSVYSALSGFWKYVYWLYLVDSPRSMRDIPLDKSYNLKAKWLGLHWVFLNGRLEPQSKRRRVRVASGSQILPQFDDEEVHDARVVDDNGRVKSGKFSAVLNGVLEEDDVFNSLLHSDAFLPSAPSIVEASVVVNYPIQTTSFLVADDDTPSAPSLPFSEWLVEQLVVLKVSSLDAEACVRQLIRAGVSSQEQLAELSDERFDRDFLIQIGVTKRSVQNHLMSIHSILQNNDDV